MIYKYCPECGNVLSKRNIGDEGSTPFCENCFKPFFNFSHPCVIVLAVSEDKRIALIRQGYVSKESFVCVAGYIKAQETAEYTAIREVYEELGLDVSDTKYIKSYYYEKKDYLMLGFVCMVTKKDFTLSSEVDNAKWFTLEEGLKKLRQGSIGYRLLKDYINTTLDEV